MQDEGAQSLLAQIPLTVSPYISLPKATTLPYTYKTLPTSLPTSITSPTNISTPEAPALKPKYIHSASGHSAHPDDIIASCQALQSHLQKIQGDAEATLKRWQDDIRERELAEKRRVAPGWLDRDEKILQPSRGGGRASTASGLGGMVAANVMDMDDEGAKHEGTGLGEGLVEQREREGEEMDRAFGGMNLR